MGATGEGNGQVFTAMVSDGVLKLAGELDLHAIHGVLGKPLIDLVDLTADVVVDLEGLSFLDSFGLSELVRIAQRLNGHKLYLRHAQPQARKVLELTGITTLNAVVVE